MVGYVQGGSRSGAVELTDEDAVRNWVNTAAQQHGRIDILYNNAGATRFAPVQEQSYQWQFTLRNELDVVFLATKHAWPHLNGPGARRRPGGSTAGITGSMTNGRVAHTVTKAA